MSTSDPDVKGWQRWQPSDLLCEYVPTQIEPAEVGDDPQSDEIVQAELAHLRQQAENNGFKQGQARGVDAGQKQGYQDGFAQGLEEGIAQGVAESKEQQKAIVERFSQLLKEFTTSLSSLDSVIPSRLVQLSLTAARSVIGENIAYDHTVMLKKIRHLLQQETLLKGHAQLRVSSEDFLMVQENLGEELNALNWVLRQDDQLLPGGCRITSEEGEFDASISTRWEELCRLSREDYTS